MTSNFVLTPTKKKEILNQLERSKKWKGRVQFKGKAVQKYILVHWSHDG